MRIFFHSDTETLKYWKHCNALRHGGKQCAAKTTTDRPPENTPQCEHKLANFKVIVASRIILMVSR